VSPRLGAVMRLLGIKPQIDLKAEREFETNLAFILDFTSPEITANKVKQGTK